MRTEYDFSKMKEAPNPYPALRMTAGINLSSEVLTYFKAQAEEVGLPYQRLINLYLLDCVKRRKKPSFKISR